MVADIALFCGAELAVLVQVLCACSALFAGVCRTV